MKEALFLDFDLAHAKDVPELLEIYTFLDYKSPVQRKAELGF